LSTFHSQSSAPQNQQPQANPASQPAAEIVINLGGSASTNTANPTANTTNGTPSSNNLASSGSDIVINLNNNPNTLEEITLTLSNNRTGTEQLNISASQGNQSPATSAAQSSSPQGSGLNVVA
jgi:hypothetical protein